MVESLREKSGPQQSHGFGFPFPQAPPAALPLLRLLPLVASSSLLLASLTRRPVPQLQVSFSSPPRRHMSLPFPSIWILRCSRFSSTRVRPHGGFFPFVGFKPEICFGIWDLSLAVFWAMDIVGHRSYLYF